MLIYDNKTGRTQLSHVALVDKEPIGECCIQEPELKEATDGTSSPDSLKRGDAAHGDTAVSVASQNPVMSAETLIKKIIHAACGDNEQKPVLIVERYTQSIEAHYQAQIQELVEVLRFYAEEDNYKKEIVTDYDGTGYLGTIHKIIEDNGHKARAALDKPKGETK